jgi:hypothetical protein
MASVARRGLRFDVKRQLFAQKEILAASASLGSEHESEESQSIDEYIKDRSPEFTNSRKTGHGR